MLPLSKESIEARARAMFLAYLSVTGNKNVRGEDVPPWEALPQKVKDAWIAAQDAERTATITEVLDLLKTWGGLFGNSEDVKPRVEALAQRIALAAGTAPINPQDALPVSQEPPPPRPGPQTEPPPSTEPVPGQTPRPKH